MLKCHKCGRFIAIKRSARPCPRCGGMDRDVFVEDSFTISETFQYAKTREFWETRKLPLGISVGLGLGSPFLGLVIAGAPGVVVGVVIGVISLVMGFIGATKVRDTERGGG